MNEIEIREAAADAAAAAECKRADVELEAARAGKEAARERLRVAERVRVDALWAAQRVAEKRVAASGLTGAAADAEVKRLGAEWQEKEIKDAGWEERFRAAQVAADESDLPVSSASRRSPDEAALNAAALDRDAMAARAAARKALLAADKAMDAAYEATIASYVTTDEASWETAQDSLWTARVVQQAREEQERARVAFFASVGDEEERAAWDAFLSAREGLALARGAREAAHS